MKNLLYICIAILLLGCDKKEEIKKDIYYAKIFIKYETEATGEQDVAPEGDAFLTYTEDKFISNYEPTITKIGYKHYSFIKDVNNEDVSNDDKFTLSKQKDYNTGKYKNESVAIFYFYENRDHNWLPVRWGEYLIAVRLKSAPYTIHYRKIELTSDTTLTLTVPRLDSKQYYKTIEWTE